jgi:hypothetical protein
VYFTFPLVRLPEPATAPVVEDGGLVFVEAGAEFEVASPQPTRVDSPNARRQMPQSEMVPARRRVNFIETQLLSQIRSKP